MEEKRGRERQFRADGVRVGYMLMRTLPVGEVKMCTDFVRKDGSQMLHMMMTADELRRFAQWLERRADELDLLA